MDGDARLARKRCGACDGIRTIESKGAGEIPPAHQRKMTIGAPGTHEMKQSRRRSALITVAVGEQRAVEIDFDPFNEEEVRIANPKLLRRTIVTLRGGRQQLVLTGLKAGDTNVSIRNEEGQIGLTLQVKVTGANLEKLAEEMRELLKDVDGLEIKVVGSKIVVEGELLTPVDYGRISAVMSDENYRPHLMNLVQMSPIALKILGDRIAQEILKRAKEQNLLDQEHPDKQEKGTDWSIRAAVVNGLVEIGGEVPAPMMPPLPGAPARDITTLCESIAESFLPPIIPVSLLDRAENTLKKNDAKRKMHRCAIAQIQPVMKNLQPITPQPMGPQPPMGPTQQIRYRVHYVLLSKDYNKVYGFKWEPSFTTDPQISIGGNAQGGPNFAGTLASLIRASVRLKMRALHASCGRAK